MDRHDIGNGRISAAVKADGAELCSLRGPDGAEVLWQAGPVWPRHAPVLFPIVGRLKDDTLRHAGRAYRMTQHGFARDRTFAWVERTPTLARLMLSDDAATREHYPFAFRLELAYELRGDSLTQTFTVANPGSEPLPASFGAHPAFAWPLRPGLAKDAHAITFERDETAPIRQVAGGLLQPEPVANPVDGRTLRLREALFAADALIFDPPASRWVRYAAPGGPAITVAWDGMRELGIWSKPADFVCIEPWRGIASPADFDGEFADKPGLVIIPPGGSCTGALTLTISSNPD